MARSPLWDNADFLSDCRSGMKKKEVMEKWGVSSGLVVDVRKKLGGPRMVKVDTDATEAGEESEVVDGPDGKKFNFIRHRPVTLEDARDLIRSTGDNPDLYHLSIKTIAYGGDKSSNKISAWPKTGMALAEAAPLEHMYAEAAKVTERRPLASSNSNRSTVVVIADWQLGKRGRRGGTPELLARLEDARQKVSAELEQRAPERILLLDGGDGIENFESGGNPMFTNDLSLPDQLDCYATEVFKFVALAGGRAPLTVGVVPSNHSAWRRSKQTLGTPADDFGIFIHRQVAKTAQAAGINAQWYYPEEYDESLCVEFAGTPVGLVHGNQYGPGKGVDWWQAQAFGAQAVTRADVLVGCHYHSFAAGVAGQNPFTGRERMFLQAPTLDSGSDWYRNIKGRDSLPGTMIFDITPDGFDLSSLTIV